MVPKEPQQNVFKSHVIPLVALRFEYSLAEILLKICFVKNQNIHKCQPYCILR